MINVAPNFNFFLNFGETIHKTRGLPARVKDKKGDPPCDDFPVWCTKEYVFRGFYESGDLRRTF